MRTPVTFKSNNLAVAGMLYLPDIFDGTPLPAIVVGHPASGVKEQTAGRYAEELSKKGFIALPTTPPTRARVRVSRVSWRTRSSVLRTSEPRFPSSRLASRWPRNVSGHWVSAPRGPMFPLPPRLTVE
jgi:hypothetical protein